jgi:hypothetical protein
MSEQSQKDEMNAAIRAQRERHNVPRSIAPEPPPAVLAHLEAPRQPEKPKRFFGRLRGK